MPKNTTKHRSRKALDPALRTLSEPEINRIAEKLAVALEHDAENISLLLLLVNHLEVTREDFLAFTNATFAIKKRVFSGTIAAGDAQERFETEALVARGTLLMWPRERAA